MKNTTVIFSCVSLMLAIAYFASYINVTSYPSKGRKGNAFPRSPYSSVDSKVQEGWNGRNVRTPLSSSLTMISFVDKDSGWVASENAVFETGDAGKTWRRVWQTRNSKQKINSIEYSGNGMGWISVTEGGFPLEPPWVSTLILRAPKPEANPEVIFKSRHMFASRFWNLDGELWVSAFRYPDGDNKRGAPDLWRIDGDEQLKDYSKYINEANSQFDTFHGFYPSVLFVGKRDSCLLTKNIMGMFLQSCDNGFSWTMLVKTGGFEYGRTDTGLGVAKDATLFWDRDHIGDTFITLLRFYNQNLSELQGEFILLDYYPVDAISAKNGDIYMVAYPLDAEPINGKNGFVLFSKDKGRTWQKIFECVDKITAVNFVGESEKAFWLVSIKGELMRLSR